jgi:hypothetical protein
MSTRNFRVPERPWPWERSVTVCIAATCVESRKNVEQRIVLCTDWRASSAIGYSDTMLKQKLLPHTMRCLPKAVYQVFEAKRAAERVTSVGDLTMLAILYPNGKYVVMPQKEYEQITKLYLHEVIAAR